MTSVECGLLWAEERLLGRCVADRVAEECEPYVLTYSRYISHNLESGVLGSFGSLSGLRSMILVVQFVYAIVSGDKALVLDVPFVAWTVFPSLRCIVEWRW